MNQHEIDQAQAVIDSILTGRDPQPSTPLTPVFPETSPERGDEGKKGAVVSGESTPSL